MPSDPPPKEARLRRTAIACGMLLVVGGTVMAAGRGPDQARAQGPVRERTVDLLVEPGTAIMGAPMKEQLGNDVRSGDIDGDGLADLIMGAHWGSDGGRNIVGRAYVAFGRAAWPGRLDLAAYHERIWSFMGRGREARMGVAVEAGDVSGDGVDDLIIGSLLADPYDQANGGAVYVMFGHEGAGGHVDFLQSNPDVIIAGNSTPFDSDRLGTDLAVADFNQDGHVDLVAAAVLRDGFKGAVFGWWGPLRAGQAINLRTDTPDWLLLGPADSAYFGASLAAGDLDGDGKPDLAVGAWSAADAGPVQSGAVYVFRGRPGIGGIVDMAKTPPDSLVVGPPNALLSGAISLGTCSCRGRPLAIADLDGDGANDLVAGAPLDEGRRGSVFVLRGPLTAPRYALPEAPHLLIHGAAVDDRLGWSVATGHLDGDGHVDLVMASPWASALGRAKVGLVYGVRGPLPLTGTLDVVAQAPLEVIGPTLSDGDAGLVMMLADTDGDGIEDLHIGFPDADPAGRQAVGAVHRIAGPLLAALPTPTSAPTATEAPTPEPSPSATDVPTEPPPDASATPEPTPTPTLPEATATEELPATATVPTLAPPSDTPTPPRRTVFLPFAYIRRH